MSNTVVAIGSNQIWSFSPAIDLLAQFPPPPPTPTQSAAPKAENAATASSAAPVAAPPAASSAPKSGVSSALARLLLAAAAPPVAAPAAASSNGALSLLLVESGDILTALKTIVLSHRHKTAGSAALTPLDLYMLDPDSSSTARHLVLLSIAFDTTLSLRARTEMFLEVYGNALIQEKTQIYLNRKIKDIRKFLTQLAVLPGAATASAAAAGSSLSQSLFRGLVDLSHLKNKELDALEASLDFMTTQHTRQSFQAPPPAPTASSSTKVEQGGVIIEEAGEEEEETKQSDVAVAAKLPDRKPVEAPAVHPAPVPFGQSVLPQKEKNAFDIETLREHRLRGYFADRFDARANLCDWDYHMRLKAVASIIHVIHYKKWRLSGMAFEERLCVYTLPNRTFASYREAQSKSRGGSVSVRGYWSDTLVSPYITLGVEASERRLFARKNHQHVKTSPHVCEFNLLSLLYELETGAAYTLPKKEGEAVPGSKGKKKPQEKKAPDAPDEEEIVELPADVPLPTSSAPMQIASAVAASSSSSSSAASASAAASSSDQLPAAVSHTTPNAVPLAHARLIFLNGTVQSLAAKSRYAGAFDRAYLSQFQVGCINETASARATAEAKKQLQPGATAVADAINGVAPAAAAATPAAAAFTGPDSLPLNKLLRPQAVITIETVKFLPVSAEIKDSYLSRVRALAASAGWTDASPASAAWSAGAFHSWSEREVEQSMEEEEKKQALTQPMIINFRWDGKAPADAAAASAAGSNK